MSEFLEDFKAAYNNLKGEYGFVCLGVAVIQDGEDSRTAFNFRWKGLASKIGFTYSFGNDSCPENDEVGFYDQAFEDVRFSAACHFAITSLIAGLQKARRDDEAIKEATEFLKKEAEAQNKQPV